MTEKGEGVKEGGVVEIASIHAVFTHVVERMAGYGKRLGEYPTLAPPRNTSVRSALLCLIFARPASLRRKRGAGQRRGIPGP